MGVKETFGCKLKKLRGDMNQKELADALGISRASVGYYENGTRTPDIEILEKASKYFRVSYDYLMTDSEMKTPDIEVRAISKKTGLSEGAINVLNRLSLEGKTAHDTLRNRVALHFISWAMTQIEFLKALGDIADAMESESKFPYQRELPRILENAIPLNSRLLKLGASNELTTMIGRYVAPDELLKELEKYNRPKKSTEIEEGEPNAQENE